MPKFQVESGVLTKSGALFHVGDSIELTKEEADRLGSKVSAYEAPAAYEEGHVYTEAEFKALGADEQKKAVEGYGGDLKEYTNGETRWGYVSQKQEEQQQ